MDEFQEDNNLIMEIWNANIFLSCISTYLDFKNVNLKNMP